MASIYALMVTRRYHVDGLFRAFPWPLYLLSYSLQMPLHQSPLNVRVCSLGSVCRPVLGIPRSEVNRSFWAYGLDAFDDVLADHELLLEQIQGEQR